MNCSVCGKPLTGGTDTFGPIDTPSCLADHWFLEDPDPRQDGLSGVVVKDIAYIKSEIIRLNGELYDKRADLDQLEAEIGELEDERYDYERKLDALERAEVPDQAKLLA